MAYVKLVTNEKGTVLRNIDMTGSTIGEVNQAATSMESVVAEEREIVHVEVNYDGCTLEDYLR